ncbi:MAG: bifunctional DNA-formamidopyrimidine glycosylase/DNA-(apurinic or apyrimidinic site) lyase [Candidatus Omnitrophica bacterium]|nr:bifunctional DNA-formamidopyrimidine glycosylase/DNA-(apurinic or apyrimidinic site) lyase [Candidatus Omnitrophota bacterium]
MPELPEVETIRCGLQRSLPGRRITAITIQRPSLLNNPPRRFRRCLCNRTFGAVLRRGKLLILSLLPDEPAAPRYLTVHLRMSGGLTYTAQARSDARVIFKLDNGMQLIYTDQRCLGQLEVVDNWQCLPLVRSMGPEPLEPNFTLACLMQILSGSGTPIKNVLLDQHKIAGIGNIYAAEALFAAGIDPRRPAAGLSHAEAGKLLAAIKSILRAAIHCRGTTFNNYRDSRGKQGSFVRRLNVYGRAAAACMQCAQPIQRIVQAGRSTYFCACCQR